jgi:hypothetical protein
VAILSFSTQLRKNNGEARSWPTTRKRKIFVLGFDYSPLDIAVAKKVQSPAETFRKQVRSTLESAIQIGKELLAVKETLPHGQFLPWLKAEFGWAERTATNFIAVADQFGKSAIIADLPIQPTAAYLLAAPAVPDEVREAAIEKAKAGEQITVTAKEIVTEAKKKKKAGERASRFQKTAWRAGRESAAAIPRALDW